MAVLVDVTITVETGFRIGGSRYRAGGSRTLVPLRLDSLIA